MKPESLIQKRSFVSALQIIKLNLELQGQKEFVLSKQLLKSRTITGANVEKTSATKSKKDFISIILIASNETHKIKYWPRLDAASALVKVNIDNRSDEISQSVNILTRIVKTSTQNL